jgi:RimJ/RimL family protein N-acetyltransferase
MPVLDTPRLRLVPLSLDVAEAILYGERPAGQAWATDYPTEAALIGASMVVTAVAHSRDPGPWTVHQVFRRDTGEAIGSGGYAMTPPDADGVVRVGYSLVPSERGHGFAAEAVRALVDFARSQPGVTRVVAETAHTNDEGLEVYAAAGMHPAALDGDVVVFEA